MLPRYENVRRKRCEKTKRPRDKGDVKTAGVKGNTVNRKRPQSTSVKRQETGKMVPRGNRVKRMRCGEKRVSREEGPKKKRCQKIWMLRGRDVNGKRLKQHRFESEGIRESLSGEKRAKSLAPELSTRRAVKIQTC